SRRAVSSSPVGRASARAGSRERLGRGLALPTRCAFLIACCYLPMCTTLNADGLAPDHPRGLRFEVRLKAAAHDSPPWPGGGRLMVGVGPRGPGEPGLPIGRTGMAAPPVLGRDVDGLAPGAVATLDGRSALFPLDRLEQVRPGTYAVQAVLHRNLDLNY